MIKTWLLQHGQVFLFALKQLIAKPVTHLCSIFVMGIALSLPVGTYVIIENLQSLSVHAAEMPQMSLFVKTDATEADINRIKQRLESDNMIVDYQFIPKQIAFQQLQQRNGFNGALVNFEKNPLPDAFVVHVRENTTEALGQLQSTLQNWPEIELVQFDSDWVARLNAILNLGRGVTLVLSILFSVTIIAIMFNTIRLQILMKREEIEISKLIGATDNFIQRPFLYFGTIQGLASGSIAWVIMISIIGVANQHLAELALLYDADFQLHYLSTTDSISLLIFSAWLGWLGARISVANHLWQIEPE